MDEPRETNHTSLFLLGRQLSSLQFERLRLDDASSSMLEPGRRFKTLQLTRPQVSARRPPIKGVTTLSEALQKFRLAYTFQLAPELLTCGIKPSGVIAQATLL